MAKTCDICGGPMGLFKTFRCQDGAVCKDCYKIVSGNYASTITQRSLSDLKKLYIQNAQPLDMGEGGFRTTRKFGAYLLLDEDNRKFCILNNQKLTGQNTKPQFFSFDELKNAQLLSKPLHSLERLTALAEDKRSDAVIDRLALHLSLTGGRTKEIVIVPSPVRTSSFAFRQSMKVALEMLDALSAL